jgi:hypothetical protein
MKKSTAILNTDSEERFPFGPYNMLLTKKEIARIYQKRRETLSKGNCLRCGEWILRKDIRKNSECPCCDTNLEEFCFEPDLKDRDKIIQKILGNIKRTAK